MKPIASLSLDLDNKWSYLKTHGNPLWESYPSYFGVVVPRILGFLEQRAMKISFFIVGKDADLDENHEYLAAIAAAGHEIGNHSYHHEPWLHQYSPAQLDEELARAETSIARVTRAQTRGFRGPGFSISTATLDTLQKRGYLYDATVFPNVLNPLARMYFFATSNLSEEEREQRKALFGTFHEAFRPVKPFRWNLGQEALLEIPVTTMPVFKIPIHLSYIIYLARYSRLLALTYFRFAIQMCRLSKTEPSILLHPLDFLGSDDDDDLRFFPGMDMPKDTKLDLLSEVLAILQTRYQIVTVEEHAKRIIEKNQLQTREPRFRFSQ
ncbi:MAG: polysaccharide deacetylase family protein [Gammaproteobacteria bacterium]|nr:polysaccharide deacetylase family protein [Gammaproteobacteria bacterium]